MRVGPDHGATANASTIHDGSGTDCHAVPDFRISDDAVGTYAAVRANTGRAQDLHEGLDDRVSADFDITVYHAGLRIENRDTFHHKLLTLGHAEAHVKVNEFGTGVAAQNFTGIVGPNCNDFFPSLGKNARHVGEVVLAVWVVSLQFVDVAEQRLGCKGVEARVDLANFALGRVHGFFFHDGLHFIAVFLSDHSTIASWILQLSGEQSHGSFLCQVEIAQLFDCFGRNERGVAREYDHVVIGSKDVTGYHQRMSGAALVAL